MKRWIDADWLGGAMWAAFLDHTLSCPDDEQMALFEMMQEVICDAPALTPPTQEQVEKVWKGKWKMNSNWPDTIICAKCCHRFDVWKHESKDFHFCPYCGCAMTPEAMKIVKKRMEELDNESHCH